MCNLVTNGDFEQVVNPPYMQNTFNEHVCAWNDFGSNSTADYYNENLALANTGSGGITSNPNPVGTGYAGIVIDYSIALNPISRPREVIMTDLVTPLLPNKPYTLTFDVRLRNRSNSSIQFQALLATTDFSGIVNHISDVPNIPGQEILFENPTFSTITTDWERITFNFNTANIINLKYLYLGNIRDVSRQNINPQTTDLLNRSYYFIDNVVLNEVLPPPTFDLPATTCATTMLPNLMDYIAGAPNNNNGTFSGAGVELKAGVYSFNPAIAGVGTHIITYSNCATDVQATIIVTNCSPPFISQVYVHGGNHDNFIEIKNKNNIGFAAGNYYLTIYKDQASFNAPPSSFIDIGSFLGLETKIFGDNSAVTPPYAVQRMIALPNNFIFDGKQILIITTTTDNTAYANRVDLAGEYSGWCQKKSLVRSSLCHQLPAHRLV